MEKLFIFENAIYYLFGFIGFVTSVLDMLMNKHKRDWKYLIQEFLYTVLAVALGIAACAGLECSPAITKIAAILMGIVGPTIIRRIKQEKTVLADMAVDTIKSKIKSKTKK